MEKCLSYREEYMQCVNSFGVGSKKCRELEKESRHCERIFDRSFCVDNINSLAKCMSHPDRSVCAEHFVAFRECHRPCGPEIAKADAERYLVVRKEDIGSKFTENVNELLAPNSVNASAKVISKKAGLIYENL